MKTECNQRLFTGEASGCMKTLNTPNSTPEPTAADPSVCGGLRRFAAHWLLITDYRSPITDPRRPFAFFAFFRGQFSSCSLAASASIAPLWFYSGIYEPPQLSQT